MIDPHDHSPPGVHANRYDSTPCVSYTKKKTVEACARRPNYLLGLIVASAVLASATPFGHPGYPIEATPLAFVATPRVVTSSWCHPYEIMYGVRGGVSLCPRVPKITVRPTIGGVLMSTPAPLPIPAPLFSVLICRWTRCWVVSAERYLAGRRADTQWPG